MTLAGSWVLAFTPEGSSLNLKWLKTKLSQDLFKNMLFWKIQFHRIDERWNFYKWLFSFYIEIKLTRCEVYRSRVWNPMSGDRWLLLSHQHLLVTWGASLCRLLSLQTSFPPLIFIAVGWLHLLRTSRNWDRDIPLRVPAAVTVLASPCAGYMCQEFNLWSDYTVVCALLGGHLSFLGLGCYEWSSKYLPEVFSVWTFSALLGTVGKNRWTLEWVRV